MSLVPGLCLLLACFTCVRCEIVLTQLASTTKKPGESVTLSCTVSGFSLDTHYISWVKQASGKGLEWLVASREPSDTIYYAPGVKGRVFPSKSSSQSVIEIRNLTPEDTAMYYCARNPRSGAGGLSGRISYWGQGTMVTVTAAEPSAPSLYGLLSCEQPSPGDSVTFGCLAMDYSPNGISVSWKKDKEPITTGLKTYPAVFKKNGIYSRISQLTISEAEAGSNAIYCVVQHSNSEYKVQMPDPEVYHPNVIVTVNSLEEIRRSRKATLVCSISDFRPAHVTVAWLRNGQSLNSGVVTSPAIEMNGNFSATSQVTFSAREWFSDSVYTCQVTHKDDTQSRNISSSENTLPCEEVHITIHPPPLEQVLLEPTVTLTCVISHAPYGVKVTWSRDNTELKSENAAPMEESPDSEISKLNISTQAWLSGDEFHCVVSHEEMPTPKRDSIHKEKDPHPREPSVSVLLPPAEVVSAQRTVALTCFVRGFSPRQVFVKWTVDDKPVDSRSYRNTEVVAEYGNRSFFMYSLLSVEAEQWGSGASFSCVVGHETLPMKTIARTVNRSSGKPSFVNVSLVLMDTVNSCQ